MEDNIEDRVIRRVSQYGKSDVMCDVLFVICHECVKCDVQPLT
jgi:hypothetical protein